jgi:hypothetical protein
MKKFEEAFNNMTQALFTLDAVQVVDWEGRGTFSGHQAIEKWFAVKFALNPGEFGGKLVQALCEQKKKSILPAIVVRRVGQTAPKKFDITSWSA